MKYKCIKSVALLILMAAVFLSACKGKKKASLSGEEPIDISDFISFFQDTELPYTITDSLLNHKISDSQLISAPVFSSFVPDSVLSRDFGKSKPKIYALGKVQEKGKENYLFIKAVQGSKRAAYVICFDKNNKYLTGLQLLKTAPDISFTSAYALLDKKFQITTYREKKSKAGQADFKRNIYIFNSATSDFTLIVTEPGQEVTEDVLNPIDTFTQKNKYTGDYVADKKNFVSFRDSHRPSEIIFFTHFEKSKGECKGELKGTARFISAKTAQYKENGNPCTLEFTFNTSSVAMKEVEGCGSYRDIKCFFDGTYPRKKKDTKQKSSKTQHKK